MLEQRIQQQFFEAADLHYQSAETLARPVAEATAALLAAITGGGKLLVCGVGGSAPLAPLTARLFTGRFERDRPPLAAVALGSDPVQELRALGLPGDALLLIDDGEGLATPVALAAQDKEVTIVAIGGRGSAAIAELLAETDVLVALPQERAARVVELQLLVLHCLCDAVDYQLMGEQDL